MGWGDRGRARLLAAASRMVAAAVADWAEVEVELAAERARADRMADWLRRWVLQDGAAEGPPTERDALDLLADHHAARVEAGR